MFKIIAIFFFAIIQGVGTAIVCWLLYQAQISHYQKLGNVDVESLSQQLANEKTDSGKPRFDSQEAAHAEAEKEATTANNVQAASVFKIKAFGGLVAVGIGIVGFIVSIFALIFTRVIKKPSDDYGLSIAERFFKGAFAEFLVATTITIILCVLFAVPAIDWALQRM